MVALVLCGNGHHYFFGKFKKEEFSQKRRFGYHFLPLAVHTVCRAMPVTGYIWRENLPTEPIILYVLNI